MAAPLDEDARRIGERVRQARRYRGKSIDTVAGLIGRSKGWLSMVENGRTRLERRSDIAALAEALQVSADDLLGEPMSGIQPDMRGHDLTRLREVLLDAEIDDPLDVPARSAEILAEETRRQDLALRKADYVTMARILPDLLAELHVKSTTTTGREREEAIKLLIQACASATIMLRHFGQTDLAWISADRARQAADLLGDPVWKAAAAVGRAHARSSANKSKALLSTGRVADELEPHLGDGTFAREVYGMLRLSAALACQVQGDHRGADEHAAEAARLAEPLGDRPDAWELFGPANVGVWRTSLAVEAGEAETALRHADAVNPQALASNNRRAALAMEKARAYAMLGADAKAVHALRAAERLSPAQTHNNPLIRELVADLLTRARREAGGRDLRGLVWRMNIRA